MTATLLYRPGDIVRAKDSIRPLMVVGTKDVDGERTSYTCLWISTEPAVGVALIYYAHHELEFLFGVDGVAATVPQKAPMTRVHP